jgi:RimJ/RimL family protein N-acetyltransferase
MESESAMNNDLFQGELVRLAMDEPEVLAEAFARWERDSEYWRLLASDPSRPASVKATRDWLEKELFKDPLEFRMFAIRRLEDERLIGEIGLEGDKLPHAEAFVGIGLGEREFWGKGYGSDAMRIILRYAFTELNLHRVSLDVFEYNPRAVRSYQKVGFVEEGRLRRFLHRDGRRWDLIFMGILREEWQRKYGYPVDD